MSVGLFIGRLVIPLKRTKNTKPSLPSTAINLTKHKVTIITEITLSKKTSNDLTLKLFQNPYVAKYANFSHYPFGRGNLVKVAYVISGDYKGSYFRAFTYHFEGNAIEKTGPGGVFSIVMIQCADTPKGQLSEQMFYENGMLCEYLRENLNVEDLHERIEKLANIANAK